MAKIDIVFSVPADIDNLKSPLGTLTTFGVSAPPPLARDRFDVLNKYSTFELSGQVDPIPVPISTSISDLIDRRAQEFAKKSCTVSWSGGVDSTVIVLALIKNGIHKDDLEIVYDDMSMLEYPALYRWLVKQGYRMRHVHDKREWLSVVSSTQTDAQLSGRCGDYLAFPETWFHHNDFSGRMYHAPLETFLVAGSHIAAPRFRFPRLTVDEAFEYADIYRESARKLFGVELTCAAELSWYGAFCLAWRRSVLYAKLYMQGTRNEDRAKAFYDTPYFQGWAVGHFDNISKVNIYRDGPQNFKREFKEYCNEVFPDSQYLLHKGKYSSWKSGNLNETNSGAKRLIIRLDDGEVLNYEIPKDRYTDSRTLMLFLQEFKKDPSERAAWLNLPVQFGSPKGDNKHHGDSEQQSPTQVPRIERTHNAEDYRWELF